MREIKFRAWDKKAKRFVKEGDLLDAYNCPTIPTSHGFKLKTSFILMQFTGLKDKNGKEIFEGDVLRTYEYNEKWDDGAIGDVTFEDGMFRINWKILLSKSGEKNKRSPVSTICSSSLFGSRDEKDMELIGNKFENPELLEDKTEE